MSKRLFLFGAISCVILVAGLFAFKRLYMTKLSTVAELHEVVGSSASGSAFFGNSANGNAWNFRVFVRELSGDPTGVHFHGPASETENGPVILTLCGGPAPSVAGPCPVLDSDGYFDLQGRLTSSSDLQPGVTGADLFDWLEAGEVYVNVHTSLNPAGEVRGQLEGR